MRQAAISGTVPTASLAAVTEADQQHDQHEAGQKREHKDADRHQRQDGSSLSWSNCPPNGEDGDEKNHRESGRENGTEVELRDFHEDRRKPQGDQRREQAIARPASVVFVFGSRWVSHDRRAAWNSVGWTLPRDGRDPGQRR